MKNENELEEDEFEESFEDKMDNDEEDYEQNETNEEELFIDNPLKAIWLKQKQHTQQINELVNLLSEQEEPIEEDLTEEEDLTDDDNDDEDPIN